MGLFGVQIPIGDFHPLDVRPVGMNSSVSLTLKEGALSLLPQRACNLHNRRDISNHFGGYNRALAQPKQRFSESLSAQNDVVLKHGL
jgi:hypothetical protein